MKHLCDANIWVAITRASHEHHRIAADWFECLSAGDSAAFCRSTQQSFLRLLTNAFVTRQPPLSNDEAIRGYRSLRRDVRVVWLEEPAGLEEKWLSFAEVSTPSPNRWMDAYLAAFALLAGARLITFDRGFRVFRGLDWLDPSRAK
jgi:toxin-antitoxin system PIN domain toxin